MLHTLIVEDNLRLQAALKRGLETTGAVRVAGAFTRGEDALEFCLDSGAGENEPVDVLLMDVALAGVMDGIQAAVAIRREFPRKPVVFYSIQDDDAYYRAFRRSGILSHYAYVRKSSYLLAELIVPLLRDAVAGRSFVEPEIEQRIQEVYQRDQHDPMTLLEPNEQTVAQLLAQGLTNEQIAARLGFLDKRTISRTNGQIYAAWGLADSTTDEKVARTRAALIVQKGRLIRWDETGAAYGINAQGEWKTLDEWNASPP
jgi:DNA-binding NarL/FixJ family response regulator